MRPPAKRWWLRKLSLPAPVANRYRALGTGTVRSAQMTRSGGVTKHAPKNGAHFDATQIPHPVPSTRAGALLVSSRSWSSNLDAEAWSRRAGSVPAIRGFTDSPFGAERQEWGLNRLGRKRATYHPYTGGQHLACQRQDRHPSAILGALPPLDWQRVTVCHSSVRREPSRRPEGHATSQA